MRSVEVFYSKVTFENSELTDEKGRSDLKRLYSAKETCNCKEPTNRSHPISHLAICHCDHSHMLPCHLDNFYTPPCYKSPCYQSARPFSYVTSTTLIRHFAILISHLAISHIDTSYTSPRYLENSSTSRRYSHMSPRYKSPRQFYYATMLPQQFDYVSLLFF